MPLPTRYFSDKQEKKVAKQLNGKQTSNSGATAFIKGDVITDLFLIECKTTTKPKSSFTLQKSWFDKNEEERFAMGKEYSAIAFDFGDGKQHYVISEELFKYLNERLLADV